MELATALIWTLRIVLPIILFWIYFKLQSPKDEYSAGPTTNCYTRSKLLEHRRAAVSSGDPVPESLESLALKGEAEAPALFAPAPGRQPRGGGTGRKPAGEPARRDRVERAERRESREPREAREAREAREVSAPRDKPREAPAAEESPPTQPESAPPAIEPSAEAGEESDKMHLESLLNYVAFNRKEQQRTFLIDEEGGAPPPPPPPPKKKAAAAATASASPPAAPVIAPSWSESSVKSCGTITISTATSGKANAEAQMVLRGAMNFKRSDVAKELYDQLADSDVEISEQTFTLMIEACILAKDLKHASDFLMKMEAKGYCPDMELLDKVMDLYSVQKVQREQEKQIAKAGGAVMHPMVGEDFGMGMAAMDGQWAPDGMMAGMQLPMAASVEGVLEEMRPKLSSAAAIYVPMFGVVGEEDGGTSSVCAPAEDEEPRAKTPLSVPQRSALSVRAKPFQPVQDVVFDPNSYTWTVNSLEGEGGEHAKTSDKGKGSGKRGIKKGDGEAKDKGKKGKGNGDAKFEEKRQEGVSPKSSSKKEKKEWKAKHFA